MLLRLGGYINILISLGHIIGLFWATQMFEVTGVGEDMAKLSGINITLPYLLTILVAIIFFIFGLYGLSASNNLKKLPFLKHVIFIIAAIYLIRGIGELVISFMNKTTSTPEVIYSLIAVIIGLLFLVGGKYRFYNNNLA